MPADITADLGSVAGVMLATDLIEELTAAAADAAESGNVAESERLALRAVDRAERLAVGPERDRALTGALRQLGTALRSRGRLDEAERAFDRAFSSAKRAFAGDAPEVAELLNDLGMTFKYAGRFAEALSHYESVTRINARSAKPPR